MDSLLVSSSSVMAIILFSALAQFYPERSLTASLSFSCIYALSLLDPTNSNIVVILRLITLSIFGLKRIANACGEAEREADVKTADDVLRPEGSIYLKRCSFAWGSGATCPGNFPEAVLRDVSFMLRPGSLVALVGSIGSGKSALLAALQGYLRILSGSCCVKGSVAYVPQIACIYNMSIRDNILFGKPLNVTLYEHVLSACDLLKDMAAFPAGDLTEVGQKGATLSGGQKQRIALARAVYSDSSVYLLDDTLSALDARVASKVFKQVIGKKGILQEKTRVIVCSQTRYLKQMDQIMLVADSKLTIFDDISELIKDPRCPTTIREGIHAKHTSRHGFSTNLALTQAIGKVTHQVTEEESMESLMGSMDLFSSAVRISGPSIVVAALSFIARAGAVGSYLVWMKQWTDAGTDETPTSVWIAGLAAICLSDVLLGWLGAFTLAVALRNLSFRLQGAMVRRVLDSPMDFFDSTPRGRVLNRFSTELENVDCCLYLSLKQILQTLPAVIARIVVTGFQAPAAGVLGGVTAAFYLATMVIMAKACNAARRLESVQASHLLQHVAETRDTLSVLRSYGVEERFCRHSYRLVDAAARALLTLTNGLRNVRFLGGLCGFLVVMASVVFAVILPGQSQEVANNGSAVGLALSASVGVAFLIMGSSGSVFFCLQTFVSVERCVDYTRLPPEAGLNEESGSEPEGEKTSPGIRSHEPVVAGRLDSATWPSKGKLEFDKYAASYKPGILPDVLHDVSFVVLPREKAGIVGRTGAGKSSLFMAVLRVLKASAGCIRIDDVDIASVPLRRLRSVVTVIPQDPCLTGGTLRNVLDPTNTCSDEDVWWALEQAHLTAFVSRHPMKILMDVENVDNNFSAGQRQLVCLARALLRRPRVLLLDEATSHMDRDTDRLVQRTLRDSFAHCTVLAIAHRLDTVLDYDKILVMEAGRVIEFGPTSSLAANPGSEFRATLLSAGLEPEGTAFDSESTWL
ncbi:multidrug resistance protein mrp-7-like [Amblyomma americanum]